MSSFSQLLLYGLEQLGKEYWPAPERLVLLELYFDELMKWRRKVNLVTRSATESEIVEKHFLDSLVLLPEFDEGSRLLDIGTGAGFPGLVCRTACPSLAVDLVEPRLKRVSFLRHVARVLKLKNDGGELVIHADRMGSGSPLCCQTFSHITCRAVAEIGHVLEIVSCLSGSGAQLLLMKGPRWQEELQMAESVLQQSQYRLERVREIVLPFSQAQRFVLIFTTVE